MPPCPSLSDGRVVPHPPGAGCDGFVDKQAAGAEVRRQPRNEADVLPHKGEIFLRRQGGVGDVDEVLRAVARHDPGKFGKYLAIGLLVGRIAGSTLHDREGCLPRREGKA